MIAPPTTPVEGAVEFSPLRIQLAVVMSFWCLGYALVPVVRNSWRFGKRLYKSWRAVRRTVRMFEQENREMSEERRLLMVFSIRRALDLGLEFVPITGDVPVDPSVYQWHIVHSVHWNDHTYDLFDPMRMEPQAWFPQPEAPHLNVIGDHPPQRLSEELPRPKRNFPFVPEDNVDRITQVNTLANSHSDPSLTVSECPHCVGMKRTLCPMCALNAQFAAEERERRVDFAPPAVAYFDPESPDEDEMEVVFEKRPEDDFYQAEPINLANVTLTRKKTLNREDRRLSAIIEDYMSRPPVRPTMKQKFQETWFKFTKGIYASKKTLKGATDEELYVMLHAIYIKGVFNNPAVCNDPYERELVNLREATPVPESLTPKKFSRICQALRLRTLNTEDYMVVHIIESCFKKNRENEKKNRQRFEPHGFFTVEHKVDPEVEARLDDLTTSVTEAVDKVKKVMDVASDTGQSMNEVFKILPLIVVIIYLGVICASPSSRSYVPLLTTSAVMFTCMYGSEIRAKLDAIIAKITTDDFEPQACTEHPIVGLALLLTGLVTVGSAPKGKRSTAFLKGLGEIPKLTDGLATISSFVIDLVVRCVNEMRSVVWGEDVEDWIVKTVPEVDKWCAQIAEIADEFHEGQLPLTLRNRDRIYNLEVRGNQLAAISYPGVEGIRIKNAMIAYNKMLKRLSDAFAGMAPHKSGVRQEPFVICFSGPPAAGKSWLARRFVAEFAAKVLPKEMLKEFVKSEGTFMWERVPEEIYHTGYANQPIVMYDDFMQARDVIGQPGEALEFIRMANSTPFTPHMADLPSKGKLNFDSKIIVMTTNQRYLEVNSLHSKEAVMRRMDRLYETGTPHEYCTEETKGISDAWERRLERDHPSLKDENGVQVFSTKPYILTHIKTKGKLGNSEVRLNSFDYDGAMADCVAAYKAKEYVSDVYYRDYRHALEAAVAERFQPEAFEWSLPTMFKIRHSDEDVCMDSLEDLVENADDAVALFSVLPEDTGLHALGTMNKLAKFLEVKYPRIWKDFSAQSASDYIRSDVPMSEKVAELKRLTQAIRSNPQRKTRMDIWVREYLSLKFLKTEKKMRQDLLSFADHYRAKAMAILEKHPKLTKVLKIVGILGAMSAVTFGLYKCLSRDEEMFISESHPKGKKHHREHRANIRSHEAQFISEAGGDENNISLIKSIVRKNLYRVTVGERVLGNVLVYRGRRCVFPYHYVTLLKASLDQDLIDQDEVAKFQAYHSDVEMLVPVAELLKVKRTPALQERDLCVFVLPRHFHDHPDLLNHFADHATHMKNLDWECTLVIPHKDAFYWERLRANPLKKVHVSDDDCSYHVMGGYTYKCASKRGDCGSILTIDDPAVRNKLFGMHVAGTKNTGTGLASALVREEFDDVEAAFAAEGLRDFPPPAVVTMEPQADMPPAPGFHPYMRLERRIYGPTESKIRRSCMYGAVADVLTRPAPLKRFRNGSEIIDPRKNALQRYSRPCYSEVSERKVKMCARSLLARMVENSAPWQKESSITFEEAVLGRPGVKFFDSIPRKTSAGYPYVLDPQPGYAHKEWYFGKGQEYDLSRVQCQDLKKEVEEVLRRAAQGERSFMPFVDVLKDETVTHAKAEIGKTRLVNACSIHLTIATRMMFMPFSKWVMDNRIENHVAVGMNPYSHEWDVLARRLLSRGDSIIAGDFSGYDSRQLSVILLAICDLINDWFNDGDENRLIRLTLFQEVINSIHISGDTVYQWASKLPSGHPLTTILNSLQALILLHLCWLDLNPIGEKGIEDFWDHVFPISYGDDHMAGISNDCRSFYNVTTITQAMLDYNQVYTDENKSENGIPFKDLDEVGFLKRGFRFDDRLQRYVAPLALDSILDTLNWYTEGSERLFVQKTNVENALKELSLHSPEVFDEWMCKITQASLLRLKFVPPIIDYTLLQDMCIGDELAW